MASSTAAVRYVAGSKKFALGTLYLRCHVKPGAAKAREGIAAVNDEFIELCVAAQAREGEANKVVVKLLSGILGVPRSDVQITQGMKSRDKLVAVTGIQEDEGTAARIRKILTDAAE